MCLIFDAKFRDPKFMGWPPNEYMSTAKIWPILGDICETVRYMMPVNINSLTERRIRAFNCYRKWCSRKILLFASWSPQSVGLIKKTESVQRRFTKRFPCCRHMAYNDRLVKLNIESLEMRRLRLDLIYVYKTVFGLVATDMSDYFSLQSTKCHNPSRKPVQAICKSLSY